MQYLLYFFFTYHIIWIEINAIYFISKIWDNLKLCGFRTLCKYFICNMLFWTIMVTHNNKRNILYSMIHFLNGVQWPSILPKGPKIFCFDLKATDWEYKFYLALYLIFFYGQIIVNIYLINWFGRWSRLEHYIFIFKCHLLQVRFSKGKTTL